MRWVFFLLVQTIMCVRVNKCICWITHVNVTCEEVKETTLTSQCIKSVFCLLARSNLSQLFFPTRSKYGTGDDGQTTTIHQQHVCFIGKKTNIVLAGKYVCVIGVRALTLPTASWQTTAKKNKRNCAEGDFFRTFLPWHVAVWSLLLLTGKGRTVRTHRHTF